MDTTRVSTKRESDLRQAATTLCDNLAPLIGCNLSSKKWSPVTAFRVCEPLTLITNGEISNLAKRVYTDDLFSYTFTPSVTSKGFDIFQQVKVFSNKIMDESYMYSSESYFTTTMDSLTRLKMTASNSQAYDSTIFATTYKNPQLVHIEQYKQIFMILLYAYTVRYYLYEYAYEYGELNEIINVTAINTLISSIEYTKLALLDLPVKSVGDTNVSIHFLCGQLNTLLKSLRQINSELLPYLR